MGDVSLFARRGHGKSQDLQAGMNIALPATPTPVLIIDALGRKCPIPIIMVAEQIRDVPIGEIIAVRADDPAAYSDIPSWCELKSHELAYREGLERGWEFGIRRRY
jgi:tRNA 2-thiouridine synthesizing protein A